MSLPGEQGEVGIIRQQIGEILGTVRGLVDTLREQKEERIRQETRITDEIRSVRQEHRQLDDGLRTRMESLTRQIEEVTEKARYITVEVAGVKKDVAELTPKVVKLVDLRNRILAYVFVMFSVAIVTWYVIGPVLQQTISNLLVSKLK